MDLAAAENRLSDEMVTQVTLPTQKPTNHFRLATFAHLGLRAKIERVLKNLEKAPKEKPKSK
jgi:hypothetical protein